MALLRFRQRVIRDPYSALSSWNDNEGDSNPCFWFGVECAEGKVVTFILRNNSFSGNIPKEIGDLKELEVLDLGYNNFSGPFPSDLGNNLSLSILLLDNNQFLGSISAELNVLKTLSEVQVDENQLISASFGASCKGRSNSWNDVKPGDIAHRRTLQVLEVPNPSKVDRNRQKKRFSKPSPSPFLSSPSPSPLPSSPIFSPSASPLSLISFPPSTSPLSPQVTPSSSPSEFLAPSPSEIQTPSPASPTPETNAVPEPSHFGPAPLPSPVSAPSPIVDKSSKPKPRIVLILSGVVGGSIFIFISAVGIVFWRSSKVVTVKPWATGLSGQLQKAFVTGVPKLQRSELVTACEDFSNIIGSLSDGTVYKGTLSSGVEIAVTSTAIDTLSKVNHKNFVNLIGYCEEDQPFTRMMVFEYAPNGTLFEHLHIKEAEHLDWGMRLRIAMGMAYCLEHMHQLTPPIIHGNLQSSSIYLTEDYAAKISDFSIWNEATASKMGSASVKLLETVSSDPESNVYNFGVLLFELITGRLPYSVNNDSAVNWASDYLKGGQPFREIVDPIVVSFKEEELEKLFAVVKGCVHPEPKQRPTMREVAARLKELTSMSPDGATPKVSPLWWAELEIMSTDSS
ncbi:hypothetical protein RJ639_003884 [Escallonia herrerae]|uniref:Protein kinase domain-containing protein n=1 Tax=Escallonia herrerae TaxID=1293975 RepID=A0AA88W461_9ASTE|nr:hypothetical protein RJ639_003884 [Escallonia herrerae]